MTIGGIHSRLQSSSKPFGRSGNSLPRMVSWRRGGSGAGAEQSLHDLPALPIGRTDMTGQSAPKTANQRKPKARKFYIISYSLAHKLADFEVENLEVLLGGVLALYPPEGRRGIPGLSRKAVCGDRQEEEWAPAERHRAISFLLARFGSNSNRCLKQWIRRLSRFNHAM